MLKIIEKKIIEKSNLFEVNKDYSYQELCDIVEIFINTPDFENSQKYLNKLINLQEKNGSFQKENPSKFLYVVSKFLQSFSDINVKKYIKQIKKSIEYLDMNFDDKYLLIFEKNENKKVFKAIINSQILSFCDELSDILNLNDYNEVADSIFMMKGKLELGFIRYFYNRKYNLLLSEFEDDGNFKIANNNLILKTLSNYNFDNDYYKNFFDKFENEIKKENNFENILIYLNEIKITNLKKFENEIKELNKKIQIFPESILSIEEFKMNKDIKKSINKDIDEEVVEIKNEKIVLTKLDTINIIKLTSNLLK